MALKDLPIPSPGNAIEIATGVFVTPETVIKVTRVLEFEGPASWVYETLRRRWLRGVSQDYAGSNGPTLSKDKVARERSLVVSIGGEQDPTYSLPSYTKVDRMSRGWVIEHGSRRIWVPDSIAGDNVDAFRPAAREAGCEYILWNDSVRGVDSDYGWK